MKNYIFWLFANAIPSNHLLVKRGNSWNKQNKTKQNKFPLIKASQKFGGLQSTQPPNFMKLTPGHLVLVGIICIFCLSGYFSSICFLFVLYLFAFNTVYILWTCVALPTLFCCLRSTMVFKSFTSKLIHIYYWVLKHIIWNKCEDKNITAWA